MEQILLTMFSEKWIIYWMFLMTFYLFIFKWIPFGIRKIEETLAESRKLQQATHEFFKQELSKISDTFIGEIKGITAWQKESNEWHIEHGRQLEEIRNYLIKK